ncbi:MAG TPA: PGPGW domain-containing protein [Terriglobia bacterium]|nr:PGPGW domain-containing protein [Terriglobia bacterium]
MRAAIKRIVLLVVGWGFILLGIVGLFLPVLQGILFILIGLIILSSEYVWAHHLLERVKARFPGVARKSHEATARAKAWLERLRGRSSKQPPGE